MGIKTNTSGRTAYEEFARESARTPAGKFRFGRHAGDRQRAALDRAAADLDPRPALGARSAGEVPGATTGSTLEESGLDVEKFKFLVCGPEVPGQEPDPCPICRPNPYAYVPDYRMMGEGETFFNGKTCVQSIVLTFDAPAGGEYIPGEAVTRPGPDVDTLKSSEFQEEHKDRAVRLMLDYFNKSETVTVFKYVEQPPRVDEFNVMTGIVAGIATGTATFLSFGIVGAVVGAVGIATAGGALDYLIPPAVPGYDLKSEEINIIPALLEFAEYTYHIPLQLKGRTRVLISIPVEIFERLPERLIQEPEAEFETSLEVVFEGKQFQPALKRVARAFSKYHGESKRWATFEGGRFVTATNFSDSSNTTQTIPGIPDIPNDPNQRERVYLNLDREADRIEAFRKAVANWVKHDDIGMSFDPLRANRIPEKIGFKFKKISPDSDDIELRSVTLNKAGCEDIKISKNGRYKRLFKALLNENESIFKDTRTLYYIGSAPEIDADLTAREPTPWLKVITDYTHPPLEILYGSNGNTIYDQSRIAGCISTGTSVDEDFDTLMSSIEGCILSAPDQFLKKFSGGGEDESCNEYDGGIKQVGQAFVSGAADFKSLFDTTFQEGKDRIQKSDPYLYIILEEIVYGFKSNVKKSSGYKDAVGGLEKGVKYEIGGEKSVKKRKYARSFRPYYQNDEKFFWGRINDRLGWCGWLAIIKSAADCVAQGMGEESSTKALAAAAFRAMDDNYLNRSFLGLSTEDQQKIIDKIKAEVGDIPAPWEAGYVSGNYSGGGFSLRQRKMAKQLQSGELNESTTPTEAEAIAELESTGFEYPEEEEEQKELLKKLKKYNRSMIREMESQGGIGLDEDAELAFNEGESPPGAGGTYGEALGAIQKEIVDAYRRTMLTAIGADELLKTMNRIPGAPIVARMFKHSPCKIASPLQMNPRLDNFLGSLEAEICSWDSDLTLPAMADKIGEFFKDIFMRLLQALAETIIGVALAIMAQVLKFILDKLLSLACDALKSLGANLADLAADNNHFENLLRESLCPDASREDMLDSLQKLFGALGGRDATCLEMLSNSEMGDFIEDLSLMLTQGQILELLTGNPTQETMRLALEVAATSTSPCIAEIFSDPSAFTTFFPALGIFVPTLEDLRKKLNFPPALLQPVYPCAPEVRVRIENLRCDLLAQKGLSKQECREQLDNLKDQAVQDLNDLLNLLQYGPFSDFPNLLSDQGCPADGFLPANDPITNDFNDEITKSMFDMVEEAHIKDLMSPINHFTGHGGVLNALLSDTMGRPFKKHNWLVRHFGSPLAEDLGFFEMWSDNAVKIPDAAEDPTSRDENFPIDIYGNMLKNEYAGKNFWGYTKGGYPPTVGAHLAITLRNMEPEFKTINTPQDAMSEYEKVKRKNRDRIKDRKKYVRAFIEEFNFRTRNTWPEKYASAADDLEWACDQVIFGKDPTKDELKHKVHSPQERLHNVLNGKNVSIAGVLTGTRKLSKWKDSTQRKLPFNADKANSFVEFYGNRSKLLELPDTSSADIRLLYDSYPREHGGDEIDPPYSVSVEYDYNLYDEETGFLKTENEYGLKIVETIRNKKGKPLSKRDIKQMGDNMPPESILGEDEEYSYTSYDLKIPGASDVGALNIIDSLNLPKTPLIPDSYQVEILNQYFLKILLDNSSVSRTELGRIALESKFRDHFALAKKGEPTEFDKLNSGFLKRISYLISTGKTGKNNKPKQPEGYDVNRGKEEKNAERNELIGLDNFAQAFKFGHSPYKGPKITYMDPEMYGGLLGKRLGDDAPKPFYVQARRFKGWLDISEALLPEVDGCEPSSKPIFDLEDLRAGVSDMSQNLLRDDRLEGDPLCSIEAPFDRIMTSEDAANLDGALRAVIRIYTLDIFIRAVPVFTIFELSDSNYDNLLESFIAERIKQGLYQDGVRRSNATDEEYYFRFLEQAVNNTVRKIDSGMLVRESDSGLADGDFTLAEEEALSEIIRAVNSYYREYAGGLEVLSDIAIKTQSIFKRNFSTAASSDIIGIGTGSSRFSKHAAEAAKRSAFEKTIRQNESSALMMLNRYIREELAILKEKFVLTLPPLVSNVHHLFLINEEWIRGAVYSDGPFDVQSDPNDPETYNIKALQSSEFEEENQNPLFKRASIDSYWPFVLEKYIRIEDKSGPPIDEFDRRGEVMSRKKTLFDIVNIEAWNSKVKKFKRNGLEGDISEFWGNPERTGETENIENHNHTYDIDLDGNGITSTHTDLRGNEHYHEIIKTKVERAQMDPGADGHKHDIPITGWKFGLRICYVPEPTSENQKAFGPLAATIDEEVVISQKAFRVRNRDNKKRYLIPIASAELPIPDQEFTLFDPDSYDVYCLIEELVKTPEYKTMFEYIFPISRFISLQSIYSAMTFFDSVGNIGYPSTGGDMWEVAGGKKGKKFYRWNRGPQAYKDSRLAAKQLFTSLYEAAQAIDFDSSNETDPNTGPTNLRDLIRPKINFEDGLRWWERGRLLSRPFDADGEDCD